MEPSDVDLSNCLRCVSSLPREEDIFRMHLFLLLLSDQPRVKHFSEWMWACAFFQVSTWPWWWTAGGASTPASRCPTGSCASCRGASRGATSEAACSDAPWCATPACRRCSSSALSAQPCSSGSPPWTMWWKPVSRRWSFLGVSFWSRDLTSAWTFSVAVWAETRQAHPEILWW